MRRILGLAGVTAALGVGSGCAAGARLMLFSSTPAFVLTAEDTRQGVVLTTSGLQPEDLEDDLCEPDESESCDDDYFLGVAFYRSDDGPYGEYVQLGTSVEPEWVDPDRPRPETVWRAGTLRREEGDETRIDEVSIAAELPASDG